MDIKNLINELNSLINEEVLDLEGTEFKYTMLPRTVTEREIEEKYPEVRIKDVSKRTIQDAMEYIKYFCKEGNLYAIRIGFEDKWLIGGFLRFDESLNESTKKYRNVVADDKYTRYKDIFGTKGRKRTLHVKPTGETKEFLSGHKKEYKDIKTGELFYLSDSSDVMTDIMGEPYTKFEIIDESVNETEERLKVVPYKKSDFKSEKDFEKVEKEIYKKRKNDSSLFMYKLCNKDLDTLKTWCNEFKRNESLKEDFIEPRYAVLGINLKRNEKEGIAWEEDFDDVREAVDFLRKKAKEEPDRYIEVIDTIKDVCVVSTDEIEDGTLQEKMNEVSDELVDRAVSKALKNMIDYSKSGDEEKAEKARKQYKELEHQRGLRRIRQGGQVSDLDKVLYKDSKYLEHLTEDSNLDLNVRKWYMKEFPTDDLGKDIPNWLTFKDIDKGIKIIYDLLAPADDSIVRERVFEKLAELKHVDYDVIYNKWINETLNESNLDDMTQCVIRIRKDNK